MSHKFHLDLKNEKNLPGDPMTAAENKFQILLIISF